MIYATCLINMLVLAQTTITFSDSPVNSCVTSFVVMLFKGQRFFNQVYLDPEKGIPLGQSLPEFYATIYAFSSSKDATM